MERAVSVTGTSGALDDGESAILESHGRNKCAGKREPESGQAAGALDGAEQADVPGGAISRRANPYGQELKIARSQCKRLKTMINRLNYMSVKWDALIGGLECDFNMLAEEVEKQLDIPDAQITDRAAGYGDGREVE